jgi:hypothetical protein
MEDSIIKSFPKSTYENGIYTIPITEQITLSIDSNIKDIYAWDDKGTDFSNKISSIIEQIDPMQKDKILIFAQLFTDLFFEVSGMNYTNQEILQLPMYEGTTDYFWQTMKVKYNVDVNRKLKILTYGTRFEPGLDLTKYKLEESFNAIVLRGGQEKNNLTFKLLTKLRGDDKRIQKEVRDAVLFESFVSNIISNIESRNLERIAIICRAGHHRSVAIAEMLLFLYPNTKIRHLTINM